MTTRTVSTPETTAEPRREGRSRGRRGLLILSVVGCMTTCAVLLAGYFNHETIRPPLTHTVTRGELVVTVTEQGLLESAENTEIKCQVRGHNTVLWVIESGAFVAPGDVLVRLDSSQIEEQVDERTKYAHWSRSAAERSEANVSRAKLAVPEYKQGRYVTQLMQLKKDLTVAQANLRSAENLLSHTQMMAESEYSSELEVEEREFAVKQAKLAVELTQTQINVLQGYTRAEQLQTLNGNLASISATHEANVERSMADASRRDRALEELPHCVVKADRYGLVIHPDAAKWETAPIEEGATVHKDQVLLLMPDLDQMQVKVGIHESIVDRVNVGQSAVVTLAGMTLEGTVSDVASITKPAGWWTGNQVKYDTLISIPSQGRLRPGMSAEVEVTLAEYEDVLSIPVAAVVESGDAAFCWVQQGDRSERRRIMLGDTDDVFVIVESGLLEGEQVVLNPLALRDAQLVASTDPASSQQETDSKQTQPVPSADTRSQKKSAAKKGQKSADGGS